MYNGNSKDCLLLSKVGSGIAIVGLTGFMSTKLGFFQKSNTQEEVIEPSPVIQTSLCNNKRHEC